MYAMKPGEFIPHSNPLDRSLVLLIGDASDVAALVSDSLKGAFTISSALNVTAGLNACGERLPDLIIIDDAINGMSADQMVRDIRSRRQCDDIPILILSREADYVLRARMLGEGVQDYVLKPFTKDELLLRARNLVVMRELERSNRMKDEFVATMSHELRTPLTAIHGWVQILRAGNPDAAVRERALESIHRNTEIQTSLIEDLLDMSRIVTGKLELEFKRVDLRDVIEDLLQSVRVTADSKGLALTARFDEGSTHVLGDPNRLRQILLNLLNNAVKFTPAHGKIDVWVKQLPLLIEIEVADDGRGIDPKFLPHIFERLRQERRSDSRKESGLGLGLAIAKSLVELHGGTIRAESAGEGKGAKFRVGIPRPPQTS